MVEGWFLKNLRDLSRWRIIIAHMAKVRANKRTLARASKSMGGNGTRSFMSGLLFGLSSASLVFTHEISPPKAPREGLASDWQAIGGDLKSVMRKRG
jgi:hypothetical protein